MLQTVPARCPDGLVGRVPWSGAGTHSPEMSRNPAWSLE